MLIFGILIAGFDSLDLQITSESVALSPQNSLLAQKVGVDDDDVVFEVPAVWVRMHEGVFPHQISKMRFFDIIHPSTIMYVQDCSTVPSMR